jgi:hypothetical protein
MCNDKQGETFQEKQHSNGSSRESIPLAGTAPLAAAGAQSVAPTETAGAQQPAPATGAGISRPNIVLVLMDNLGYGELGVYGGSILRGAPTPRLDTLAAEGTRLLNFNVEA